MDRLQLIISRYRKLKQYKDLSDEQITKLAEEKLLKEKKLEKLNIFSDDDEKELASSIMDKYSQYNLEDASEKDTLNQLVYLEVIVERVKKFIDKEFKDKQSIPMEFLEELRALNSQVLDYKKELGINKEKEQEDWVEVWDELRQKALNYYETHKGCNTVKCPYCNQLFNLLMRTENLTPEKSTWFKGTLLYNNQVFALYDEKKITKDDAAKILGVSEWYIDFIYTNLYLKEKNVKTD